MRSLLLGASLWLVAAQGDGIIRLKPGDFGQLPAAVRRDLDRRGCRIPQLPDKAAPHNVITGSFITSGSRDWAVLCSVKGRSRILVYRNGSVSKVDSVARHDDRDFLQAGASGAVAFSRKIFITEAKAISEGAKGRTATKPPIDHDGIGEALTSRGVTVHYYRGRKWLEFQMAN